MSAVLLPIPPQPTHPVSDVPPEAPLEMPRQPLSADAAYDPTESDAGRVSIVILASAFGAIVASLQFHAILVRDGMTPIEWIGLGLFAANFAWISGAATTAIIGAIVLALAPRRPAAKPAASNSLTAIVFPIRNESPERVFGAARAIHDSLLRAGGRSQEFFFLSDTNSPAIAAAETAALRQLREIRPEGVFHYRRRTSNEGRKAGNIADFVRRWGGRYEYMVVLDADSIMSGSAILSLQARMDASPRTALIQTFPTIINASTLFARLQQFAMRSYGQIFGAGLAWWSGGAGNFWGHNAIIRVKAFAAHAGLPILPGPRPLGGEVLSHDFVEAALLRRAGWRVEIAPDIGGSYEEAPPTLVDIAARDRRWAQGSIQHLSVLSARGLDPSSRSHILAGVMGYLSAPMWLALIVTGLLAGLRIHNDGPDLSGDIFDASRSLFVFTALIVFSPKWLALLLWSIGALPGWSRSPAFVGGVLLEAIVSCVTAPIMMISQTISVVRTLVGVDVGWGAQIRHRTGLSTLEAASEFTPHLAIGAVLCVIGLAGGLAHVLWLAPIWICLVLAQPVSLTLARPLRRRSWLWRLTATPECLRPPNVVRSARVSTVVPVAAPSAPLSLGDAMAAFNPTPTPAPVPTRGAETAP